MEPTVIEPVVSSNNKDTQRETKRSLSLVKIAGAFFALIILATLTLLIGIYSLGWQRGIAVSAAKDLHLPAAKVSGKFISTTDYFSRLDSLSGSVNSSKEAMLQLVDQIYISDYAHNHNLSVSSADIAYYTSQTNSGSNQAGQRLLKLSPEEVRNKILINKIQLSLPKDPDQMKMAESKAASILKSLQAGEDFSKAQKEASGGAIFTNVNVVPLAIPGLLPKEVIAATDTVQEGQLVDHPVLVGNGYMIIKRATNVSNMQKRVYLIFIAPTFPDWLAYSRHQQPAHIFMPHAKGAVGYAQLRTASR